MRGAAKHFNTLADVENSMIVDAEGTKALLRTLLDGRFAWFDTGLVPAGSAGTTDATHKVVAIRDAMGAGGMDDGPAEPHQFELREDPNAWMFKIGLTVELCNAYLEA